MLARPDSAALTTRTLSAMQIALLVFFLLAYPVAFDQGGLASLFTDRLLDSGGVLHELFHDARHVIGVPCH